MNKPIVPREIQKVFQGRIFTVQIETITLPKGGEMKAEIVRHPGSVVIVPVTDGGEIILVRQYRPAIGRWAWELPAGTLKDGEDPRASGHPRVPRGDRPDSRARGAAGAFFPTPGYCDEEMNFYRATGLRPPGAEDEAAQPDEDEDIEPQAVPDGHVEGNDRAGEIIDLKTVAGLALLDAPPDSRRAAKTRRRGGPDGPCPESTRNTRAAARPGPDGPQHRAHARADAAARGHAPPARQDQQVDRRDAPDARPFARAGDRLHAARGRVLREPWRH